MVDPAELGFAPPERRRHRGRRPGRRTPRCCGACWAARAGPARDVVVLNAAAAIWLAGGAPEPGRRPCPLAEESIDVGAARERLDAFVATTRRLGGA